MAHMEIDRAFRLRRLAGLLLIMCNGAWIMTHWHKPANRISDLFVFFGVVGVIVVVDVDLKRRRRSSNRPTI